MHIAQATQFCDDIQQVFHMDLYLLLLLGYPGAEQSTESRMEIGKARKEPENCKSDQRNMNSMHKGYFMDKYLFLLNNFSIEINIATGETSQAITPFHFF